MVKLLSALILMFYRYSSYVKSISGRIWFKNAPSALSNLMTSEMYWKEKKVLAFFLT